jgi:hypothetical protein
MSFIGLEMRNAMTMLSLRGRTSRRLWGVIGLALFLTLQLFTVCEPLHKLIHPDADSEDHHCAVTLFSHGQVTTAETVLPLIGFVAALFFLLPPLQSAVFSPVDFRFAPSRAPPLR